MSKSDILVETWNQKRHPVSHKIVNAWEIIDPNKIMIEEQIIPKSQTVLLSYDMANPTCKKDNSCISESDVKILQGGTVTWENTDSFIPAITSGIKEKPDGLFDEFLMPGDTFEQTYMNPGEYDYFCPLHPWAEDKIIVYDVFGNEPDHEYESLLPLVVSSETSNGSVMIENSQALFLETRSMWFDISGNLEKVRGHMIDIVITKPDKSTEVIHTRINDNGYFSTPLNLGKWSPGAYSVKVMCQSDEVAKISFFISNNVENSDVTN